MMNPYRVTLTTRVNIEVMVEAANERSAKNKAMKAFDKGKMSFSKTEVTDVQEAIELQHEFKFSP